MNVLIMSISKKVPMLKAVKESIWRVESNAQVYGADTNVNCIGKFFVDQFWHCPQLDDLLIYDFIRYCLNHRISIVFPSRDGELEYFSKHLDVLEEHGIHVMVSNRDAVNTSMDKLEFSKVLRELGYPAIPSYTDIDFPSNYYVIKERYGAGSNKVGIKLVEDNARKFMKQLDAPIIQPFIDGTECSADVYIDKSKKTKGVVIRERNFVVQGESQITSSFRNESLECMFSDISEQLCMSGHVMFQFIKDYSGDVHIIECNARFGGASTLSLAMGLDSFYWFIQESRGVPSEELPFHRSPNEKILVRHAEDLIL